MQNRNTNELWERERQRERAAVGFAWAEKINSNFVMIRCQFWFDCTKLANRACIWHWPSSIKHKGHACRLTKIQLSSHAAATRAHACHNTRRCMRKLRRICMLMGEMVIRTFTSSTSATHKWTKRMRVQIASMSQQQLWKSTLAVKQLC